MLNEQDLQAIAKLMDAKLDPINKRLDKMQEDISELKEGQDEIRSSVNRLIEWADECGYVVKFPLPKI